jgi:hypothetical protein
MTTIWCLGRWKTFGEVGANTKQKARPHKRKEGGERSSINVRNRKLPASWDTRRRKEEQEVKMESETEA